MRDLVFIDTETTGLSPRRHEVIDIWARRVRADTLDLVAEAGGLVLPKRIDEADPEALAINGYDPDRWAAEARPWADVWAEVEPLIDGATIVAHNIAFDARMINAACIRDSCASIVNHDAGIDTVDLAQPLKASGLVGSVSLDTLVGHFGIEIDGALAHSARGDVLRTVEVYRRLVEEAP